MRAKKWIIGSLAVVLVILLLSAGWLFGLFQPDIPTAPRGGAEIELVRMPGNFTRPVQVIEGPDGLAVVEQGGRIVAPNGSILLDLSSQVSGGSEQGLLAALWHNGTWLTHYTDRAGDTVLSQWSPNETILWTHAQPYSNHNGGMLAFGPDQMLYLGLGDGGLAADPDKNAQNTDTHLGGILRFNWTDGNVSIPSDNPFSGSAPYLFHYGLRNPWRFSFDGADLWIGDVGQGNVEEISVAPAGSRGLNFGWPHYEGSHRFKIGSAARHVGPMAEYDHDDGCSVTGGYVIRDGSSADGAYIFGDFCSGKIWTISEGTLYLARETSLAISSFGQGANGTVYVVDYRGAYFRVEGSRSV